MSDWLECWWIAEDERYDRSDLDSAVFVPPGIKQEDARDLLRHAYRIRHDEGLL